MGLGTGGLTWNWATDEIQPSLQVALVLLSQIKRGEMGLAEGETKE